MGTSFDLLEVMETTRTFVFCRSRRSKRQSRRGITKKHWIHMECELTAAQRTLSASRRPGKGNEKSKNLLSNEVDLDLPHFIGRMSSMLLLFFN